MDKQSEQQELKDIIATREDGFGYRFKTARDEKNLSIDDISQKLHLSKQIIQALESEDYTQLPVAAFVCGYIRNYAKLLKIPPEPLLEYYKNNRSDDALNPELKIIKGREVPGSSIIGSTLSVIVKPLLSLLIILVLAMGGWKLWGYLSSNFLNNTDDQSIELEAISQDVETDIEKMNADASVLLLPKLDGSYDSPEEDTAISQDEGSLLTEPAENSLLTEGSTSSSEISSLAAGNPSPGSTESTPEMVVDNQLILEFSGNSWVSIKDANNKILAMGLKKAPKILKLEGKMPYKVFLGDARVVKVSLSGKVFDHAKYINEKNVARFNVK